MGALLVRGTLVWDDTTQAGAAEQWLCAGYVAVEQHVVKVPPSAVPPSSWIMCLLRAGLAAPVSTPCTPRRRPAHPAPTATASVMPRVLEL